MAINTIGRILLIGLACSACSAPTETQTHVLLISTEPSDLLGPMGQELRADFELDLESGQRVSFFDVSGHFHTIKGPFLGQIGARIGLPRATDTARRMKESAKEFLSVIESDRQMAGATRSLLVLEPWELSSARFSDYKVFCIPKNGAIKLTRETSEIGAISQFDLKRSDGEPLLFEFEENALSIEVPTTLLSDGVYSVGLGEISLGLIRMTAIPAHPESALGLELYSNDCTLQFKQFIISAP